MSTIDRRKFLQRASAASAAAGAIWAAPSVVGSSAAFAAGSGTTTYSQLVFYKYNNSQNTYSQITACHPGYLRSNLNGATQRGTVDANYTSSTGNFCFTVTLSSGPSIGTRTIYVLPSNAAGCLGAISTGMWVGGTSNTYTACALSSPWERQKVAISAEESGGGGTAVYIIDHITL